MNSNQLSSLFRTALKFLAGILAAHGMAKAGSMLNEPDVVSAIIAVCTIIWSHVASGKIPPTDPGTTAGANWKLVLIIVLVLPACLVFTGCTSIINNPNGKIVSITERGIGFKIEATSSTTQTPDVTFGFFSSAIVFVPTSTNAPIYSPNFANTFDFAQSGALSLGIGENIASGNYQTLSPGSTNAAITTQPITPK